MDVFLPTLLVYVICAAGYVDTVDADASLETARALFYRRSIRLWPARIEGLIHAPARGGGWVSKLGLAHPLLYLPAVGASHGLCWALGLRYYRFEETFCRAFVSLVNGVLSAATVSLVPIYFGALGAPHGKPVAWALAFATPLFPYAKTCHREPLQGLCLMGILTSAACLAAGIHPLYWALAAGTFAGIGTLTKKALLLPMAPLLLYTHHVVSADGNSLTALYLPFALALCTQAGFDRLAHGGLLHSGYSAHVTRWKGKAWSTPFWRGLWKQLLARDTGLIWFCPTVCLPIAVVLWQAVHGLLTTGHLAILASVVVCLSLHARWWAPTGDCCLGPRYTLPVIPLLAALCADAPASLWQGAPGAVALVIIIGSFVLQMIQVAVKPQQYWTLRALAGESLPTPHWLANGKLLWRKLSRMDEVYSPTDFGGRIERVIDLRPYPSLRGLNFWWAHAYRRFQECAEPLPRQVP